MEAAPGPVPEQLTLELPHRPETGLADFLRAPCNAAALDAVLAWPDWPGPVLVLSGRPASGKTHLARIWAERARAVLLRGGELRDAHEAVAATRFAAACLVDDADAVPDEALLFHLHNAVVGRGGWLLLTSALRPPPGRCSCPTCARACAPPGRPASSRRTTPSWPPSWSSSSPTASSVSSPP